MDLSEFQFHELEDDLTIEVVAPPPPLSAATAAVVEAIWTEQRARRSGVYNGTTWCLVDHTRNLLVMQPNEYRTVLAHLRAADPPPDLAIQPLAVSGILVSADGLVLGRRGEAVTESPGLWELAPSGGLDRPDPKAQILAELAEEVGLVATHVSECRMIGMIENSISALHDLVFELRTSLGEAQIRHIHAASGSGEYDELTFVERSDLPRWLEATPARIPITVPILRAARMIG